MPRPLAVLLGGALLACSLGLVGCGGSDRPANEVAGVEGAADVPSAVTTYRRAIGPQQLTEPGTGGITGVARKPSGALRTGARISLHLVAADEDADVEEDVPAAATAAVRTGTTGAYGFANVPPGLWRVRCDNRDGTFEAQVLRVRADAIERCTFGGDRTVASVELRPATLTLNVGERQRLRTIAKNAAGHLLTGLSTTWSTSKPAVAPVSQWGVVRGKAEGSAEIRAQIDGVIGTAQVTVLGGGGGGLTNLFFLHHSTGDGIVVEGRMRNYIRQYNDANGTSFEFWDHGYNGDGLRNPAGVFTGTNYNIPGDNTDPDGLHRLWTGTDATARNCRNTILNNHEVIAFKSCFPASAISDAQQLNQYKTWYLQMRSFFDTRPDRVFVVMSTPPLHRLSTNATEAKNARRFANWLKSAQYLSGHPNVVCFDLFDELAAPDDGSARANRLRYEYEGSHSNGDSHPNTKANRAVGPVFAQALIDAAGQ